MKTTERACSQCGVSIVGRFDKRFCSDQCRAAASNTRKLSDSGEQLIRSVNAILRQNRKILRHVSPEGKTTVRRQVLELAGFDFSYVTNLYRTRKGNTYSFCYDYGYLLLPEEKVLIVKLQPYMQQV